MDWLIKIAVIWISVDIILISTFWYATMTLRQLWPDWWRQSVIDNFDSELGVKNF